MIGYQLAITKIPKLQITQKSTYKASISRTKLNYFKTKY